MIRIIRKSEGKAARPLRTGGADDRTHGQPRAHAGQLELGDGDEAQERQHQLVQLGDLAVSEDHRPAGIDSSTDPGRPASPASPHPPPLAPPPPAARPIAVPIRANHDREMIGIL